MKRILPLIAFLLILSCKEEKKKEEIVDAKVQMSNEPKQWLTFEGKSDGKNIVLISGDEEYRSEEALPQLAKILSKHHGFNCTVLFAQEETKPGMVNANYLKNIPGLEALESADLMVIFTRFRALPDNQMKYIDDYLKSGKPVMGIRTATHAFNFDKDSDSKYTQYGNYYEGDIEEWHGGFGRLVLGEKWINHHGHHKHQSTKGIIAEGAEATGIVNGIEDGDVWGASDVYGVRLPLVGDAQPIILGKVMNRKGEYDETDIFFGMKPTDDEPATINNDGLKLNDPMMPVTWVKSYQLPGGDKGKAFTTTVGAANDMLIEGTRRLLVNGIFWLLDFEVPEKAKVDLVGDYKPTKFEFRKDEYWPDKKLMIESLQ
ncbi:MAG: hypothetical protein CML04_10770 [Pseudozobellia sp.]|nr:hypothetical protein [Pseudozobellia sp.]MBG47011.1 hypothetical protein [Pseudozobellia sp.]|tara:strand:+ start:2698 stop:3816 length:1119 start_codon:yes stop_codon:yes gene_type:complete